MWRVCKIVSLLLCKGGTCRLFWKHRFSSSALTEKIIMLQYFWGIPRDSFVSYRSRCFNMYIFFFFFFAKKKDSYFPFLVPSVHTEWNKQEVNELVSGRAWLDRWHGIYLVACFPSAWLSPWGQFETFNLVSKPSPEPGGWTIHDGFRRTADTVYFWLHATISVGAGAWKNHARNSMELTSTRSGERSDADLHLMHTVFPAGLTGQDGGLWKIHVLFSLMRTFGSPHWFKPAIHQACVTFIPCFV